MADRAEAMALGVVSPFNEVRRRGEIRISGNQDAVHRTPYGGYQKIRISGNEYPVAVVINVNRCPWDSLRRTVAQLVMLNV